MDICIDFDGTCVSNEFPEIGNDIGSVSVLKKLVDNGHNLILYTIRCDKFERDYLLEAVEWFKSNNIKLYDINKNPKQAKFSNSPKVFADKYIDDLFVGCPLKHDINISLEPFVDWKILEQILIKDGIIK